VAKSDGMSAATVTDIEQFERMLLRHSVGVLTAGRHRCADCGRTPLVGERMHLYEEHGGEVVCELCHPLRRGHPAASETVRYSPHGNCVLVETGTDKGDTRFARVPESASAEGARRPAAAEMGTRAEGACLPAAATARAA
jgi:hypothetical protein